MGVCSTQGTNDQIMPSWGRSSQIHFEKLTAQIGAQSCLVTQLCFQAPDDLRFDIIKTQQLTLVRCPLENGQKLAEGTVK